MRKIIAFFIVAAMAVAMAGCGQGSTQMENKNESGNKNQPAMLLGAGAEWNATANDRRSDPFTKVVFAGDILCDWQKELSEDISHYQAAAIETAEVSPSADEILAENGDLIIIADGTMALLDGEAPTDYAKSLKETVKQIKSSAQGAVILVTSLPYVSQNMRGNIGFDTLAQFNACIRAAAMEEDVLYANIYRAMGQTLWSLDSDGITPSDVGNSLIAGEILSQLMRNCRCLAVQDGIMLSSASIMEYPRENALSSFKEAADDEAMSDALNYNLGAELHMYQDLSHEQQKAVREKLLGSDRSKIENYMQADALINYTVMELAGEKSPDDYTQAAFRNYVAVGDSITEGYMSANPVSDAWVPHLGLLIEAGQGSELSVMNEGIGGTKMSTWHEIYQPAKNTVEKFITSKAPDLLTIAYGINDFHAGTTLDTFIEDFKSYLTEITDSCPDTVIVVCGLCCKGGDQDGAKLRTWNDAVKTMTEEFGLIYCDTYEDFHAVDWLLSDGLHPDNAGYRFYANTVFRTISANINLG